MEEGIISGLHVVVISLRRQTEREKERNFELIKIIRNNNTSNIININIINITKENNDI